ncbi:MAG: methyltransferase domain-containing protein [Chlamydiota bacterium]
MKNWIANGAILTFLLAANFAYADEWSGADYAKNSLVQQTHGEQLLSRIPFTGNEAILDVGCGDGRVTATIAVRVPEGFVIGIDPSDSMLDKAQSMLDAHANLTFAKGAAESFSLDQRFDHAFSFYAMHWVVEQERALQNIYSHLKPNGQLHVIFAPSKEGLPFDAALQKTLLSWKEEFADFVNPLQVFDTETYRKMLVGAGFHVQSIQYVYYVHTHENKEKLKSWVKQWLPQGKHLSPSDQDLFMDELFDNYFMEVGLPSDTQGPVTWGEYKIIAEAIRAE